MVLVLTASVETRWFCECQDGSLSGNVVFDARAASERTLERKAEAAMAKALGRTFLTIVRPVDALQRLIDSDPYAGFRPPRNAKRVVTFLRERHKGRLQLPLETRWCTHPCCSKHGEAFTAYVPNPRGPAFMRLIEKTFGSRVTTRTWDTVSVLRPRNSSFLAV